MSINDLCQAAVVAAKNYDDAGKSLTSAVDRLLKGGVLDALDAGTTSLSILAGELGISPATVGYNVATWRAAALEEDGTPITALYTAAVACHKTTGVGYSKAAKVAQDCKTRGECLRQWQRMVHEAAIGKVEAEVAKANGTEVKKGRPSNDSKKSDADLVKAMLATAKGLKKDGTLTADMVAELTTILTAAVVGVKVEVTV